MAAIGKTADYLMENSGLNYIRRKLYSYQSSSNLVNSWMEHVDLCCELADDEKMLQKSKLFNMFSDEYRLVIYFASMANLYRNGKRFELLQKTADGEYPMKGYFSHMKACSFDAIVHLIGDGGRGEDVRSLTVEQAREIIESANNRVEPTYSFCG